MKEIDKALTRRFRYKDIELKWVLQSLHCHHRESWKTSLDPYKIKLERKRKGTNSQKIDISIKRSCNIDR